MGAIERTVCPAGQRKKAAALRQDYQREKAAEKQRLEEFLTARRGKETSENLRRPRAAQTRGKEKRRGAMMELEIQTMQPGERLYAYRQSKQLEGQTGGVGYLQGRLLAGMAGIFHHLGGRTRPVQNRCVQTGVRPGGQYPAAARRPVFEGIRYL